MDITLLSVFFSSVESNARVCRLRSLTWLVSIFINCFFCVPHPDNPINMEVAITAANILSAIFYVPLDVFTRIGIALMGPTQWAFNQRREQ